jgi:hypothetical protein
MMIPISISQLLKLEHVLLVRAVHAPFRGEQREANGYSSVKENIDAEPHSPAKGIA